MARWRNLEAALRLRRSFFGSGGASPSRATKFECRLDLRGEVA